MKSKVALPLFFALFFAVGIGMLIYASYSTVRSMSAARWPVAEGRLLSAEMVRNTDSKGTTTQRVEVTYQYVIDEFTYTGHRLAFGYTADNDARAHQEILDKLRSGDVVEVRYSPADRSDSTLSYGFHRSVKFTFVFAVTWLLFTSGMAFMFWLFSNPDNVLLNNLIVR